MFTLPFPPNLEMFGGHLHVIFLIILNFRIFSGISCFKRWCKLAWKDSLVYQTFQNFVHLIFFWHLIFLIIQVILHFWDNRCSKFQSFFNNYFSNYRSANIWPTKSISFIKNTKLTEFFYVIFSKIYPGECFYLLFASSFLLEDGSCWRKYANLKLHYWILL